MDIPIVLATANARYGHTAFGLRWLHANLGPLRDRALIREFTIRDDAMHIARTLIDYDPRVIGLGVYIWNIGLITETVRLIKAERPEITVVVGGPEISYEYEGTALFNCADYLVCGEGEPAFADLAARVMAGKPPAEKVLYDPPGDLDRLRSPYDEYTGEDIARRTLYVESSRGCPYRCAFCLSSIERGVREFPLEPFLADLAGLMKRGARRFKFVDRTFNLRPDRVEAILGFFLARKDGVRLHFEIVPDRLTPATLDLFAQFPPGALHLEAGVQSCNPETLEAVSRRQNVEKTIENLQFLRNQTGAILHADLIAGLPGESLDSFGRGFDALVALRPHELQVGILKRLKGTPLARYAGPHSMTFRPDPPYDVLETDLIDAHDIERIKRFARYFDIYYNSGNFPQSCPAIWKNAASPFQTFMAFSDGLWGKTKQTHAFPLADSARLLFEFLITDGGMENEPAAALVETDFRRVPGRKDRLRLH
ncbi:MAG TPA: radical SAM protein [Candidatus Bathyarchaeia archaeon]|nr:radical SAM protein [Candidatus Bathyarchaeia archaeon]